MTGPGAAVIAAEPPLPRRVPLIPSPLSLLALPQPA